MMRHLQRISLMVVFGFQKDNRFSISTYTKFFQWLAFYKDNPTPCTGLILIIIQAKTNAAFSYENVQQVVIILASACFKDILTKEDARAQFLYNF